MSNDKKEPKQLGTDKTQQVLQLALEGSAKEMIKRWNEYNPEDPIDIRFVYNETKLSETLKDQHKNQTGELLRAQATLTMELRRNFQWQVLVRQVQNFRSVAAMERAGVHLRLELWSLMFVEITHMGFIAGISSILHRQQTNDHKHEYPISESEAVGRDQATDFAHLAENQAPAGAGL